MANYITTLQDKDGTNTLLPRTALKALSDDNGNYLDSGLSASDINALKNGKIGSIDNAISDITNQPHCVESIYDANSHKWLRVYSDGWIEQGGYETVTLTQKDAIYQWTASYLRPFNTSFFIPQVTLRSGWIYSVHGGAENVYYDMISGYIRSDEGTFPRDAYVCWSVCGY